MLVKQYSNERKTTYEHRNSYKVPNDIIKSLNLQFSIQGRREQKAHTETINQAVHLRVVGV